MTGVRGIARSPGKRKRLLDASLKSGRAGTNSTVIEVSIQIEAQQRLEERPEHCLAARERSGKTTPKHNETAFKFCDGGRINSEGNGTRRGPRDELSR